MNTYFRGNNEYIDKDLDLNKDDIVDKALEASDESEHYDEILVGLP